MAQNPLRTAESWFVSAWLIVASLVPVFATPPAAAANSTSVAGLPKVFLLDARQLDATRAGLRAGETNLVPALATLEREAKEALKRGPFSVVNKDQTPPSGDKHDYMSLAPYFWPDASKPDGLPYLRRDGERNPASRTPDRRALGDLIESVETLGLAYYFTGNEACATKAAQLLRGWFLDPDTRMNPNFQYAQAVPGVNSGRGIGLIETAGLTAVVDAIGLLAGSKAWMEADQRGLEDWFSRFLRWMQESRNGRDEASAKNNHGTYYDLQVASFALFVGNRELATNVLRNVGPKRIARQIEPDGRQPLELARTKSWGYSTMNLRGLMSLATLGEQIGVDLWHFESPDGRSLRKALDYLAQFASGEKKWPHQQLGGWSPGGVVPLLRQAAFEFPDSKYREMALTLARTRASDRSRLISPLLPGEEMLGSSDRELRISEDHAQPK